MQNMELKSKDNKLEDSSTFTKLKTLGLRPRYHDINTNNNLKVSFL